MPRKYAELTEKEKEIRRDYARKHRANNIDKCRERDAARKREGRQQDSPYARRVRKAKRSEEYKVKRREGRKSLLNKIKGSDYMREYRARPENKAKEAARAAVKRAVKSGRLVRADSCSFCHGTPGNEPGGRSPIRADHYMGYRREHWLVVQWVCASCDGTLERFRKAARDAQARVAHWQDLSLGVEPEERDPKRLLARDENERQTSLLGLMGAEVVARKALLGAQEKG